MSTEFPGSIVDGPNKLWYRRESAVEHAVNVVLSSSRQKPLEENEFWKLVRETRVEMEETRLSVTKAKNESEEAAATWAMTEREESSNSARKGAKEVTRRLREISKNIEKLRQGLPVITENDIGKLSADVRSRCTAHSALCQEYANLAVVVQESMAEIDTHQRALLSQQLRAIDTSLTAEEANYIVESGQGSDFLAGFKNSGKTVTNSYILARERHDAILEIEASMMEIRQMMADMLALLSAQSKLIRNVETNVELARQNVGKGKRHIEHAVRRQRRRYHCVSITICVLVGIICVIITFRIVLQRYQTEKS